MKETWRMIRRGEGSGSGREGEKGGKVRRVGRGMYSMWCTVCCRTNFPPHPRNALVGRFEMEASIGGLREKEKKKECASAVQVRFSTSLLSKSGRKHTQSLPSTGVTVLIDGRVSPPSTHYK